MNTEKINKVELHVHLDGSLRPQTVYELCKKDNIELPSKNMKELKKYLSVDENNKDLVEYLKRFHFPVQAMQSKENLERVAFELVEDLSNEGYIYAEIRFAPHLHTAKGLTLDEVVESVLAGIKMGTDKYDIEIGLLLCVMRHMEPELGFELVNVADKFLTKGVAGLDLAGDEFNFSAMLFKEIFAEANKRNIPFTIHAGEARGAESVKEAIELGAKRIGHGIRAVEDEAVIKLVKENDVCLENCPVSNLHTHAIPDFAKYPTVDFLKQGIKVNLSTDNRTVSNTNYQREVDFLDSNIEISKAELFEMNKNGILAAFISDEKKQKLLKKL